MGIPTFFRWLSLKYPKILVPALERKKQGDFKGTLEKEDTSQPNLNGIEFDNFYLDMNGIIHPCSHPVDKEPPKTEEEMMIAIGDYIDRLFSIVRPRKLIYFAIDGVAPRAKMNQQRARRFRAAREKARERKRKEKNGEIIESTFDSNCITPGTIFMEKVTNYLRYYICQKLNNDPGWKRIKVILSDSNVPGEGEHKIMQYIRNQRNQSDYDPNLHHCIYGLDADLIMLGLATHEVHFSILREIVFFEEDEVCYKCNEEGHLPSRCPNPGEKPQIPFHFLHLNILREYLKYSLSGKVFLGFDLEKCIDDWVFISFFVGNDFLPHLPTLEIRENGIDFLVDLYKRQLPEKGYITENGKIHYNRLDELLRAIAQLEDGILVERNNRLKLQKLKSQEKREAFENSIEIQNLKAEDSIKLGEPGWKSRYYREKFGVELTDRDFLEQLKQSYIEGLTWVFEYYFHGCPSWNWFYPFHYAPFSSELCGLNAFQPTFSLSKPFSPIAQLMGVLPSASSSFLPSSFRRLMEAPDSPIKDFYPEYFEIDMIGKKFEWQGVALLPFIDEAKLIKEIELLEKKLSPEEKKRNSVSNDVLFIHITHPLSTFLQEYVLNNESKFTNKKKKKTALKWISLPSEKSGINGLASDMEDNLFCEIGENFPAPFSNMDIIPNSQVLIAWFKDPEIKEKLVTGLLPGAIEEPRQLTLQDLKYKPRHYFFQKWPIQEDRRGMLQILHTATQELIEKETKKLNIEEGDEQKQTIKSQTPKQLIELQTEEEKEEKPILSDKSQKGLLKEEQKKNKQLLQEIKEYKTKISKLEYENKQLKKQLKKFEKTSEEMELEKDNEIVSVVGKRKREEDLETPNLQPNSKKQKPTELETPSPKLKSKHLVLNSFVSISSSNPETFLSSKEKKKNKKQNPNFSNPNNKKNIQKQNNNFKQRNKKEQ